MKRSYWLAAVIGLSVGLFFYFPAALAARLQARMLPELQLYGVSGTLLHGRAAALRLRGLTLENAEWDWHPLALLLARFSADVRAEAQSRPLQGRVSLGLGGRVKLSDFTALLDTTQFGPLLGLQWLPVEGQLDIVLDELRLKDQQPRHAQGRLALSQARWRLVQPSAALGDFNAELTTDDGRIVAALSSGSGPLKLGGTAEVDAAGAYKLDLRLEPAADADPSLLTILRGLGEPDAQGNYRLQLQGKLPGSAS